MISQQKALVTIDGEVFYRTGDLVRIDNNGLMYYRGRKDHQIKLHGQRIELGEIERCLLDTSISACVVIKWGDDHLVAYVQSSDVNEKQLRDHCQSHLPPHMIPSIFIILEKLPLNVNGKVDRKLLPSPDFSQLPSSHVLTAGEYRAPTNEMEVTIHDMWCDIFQRSQISTDANIFSIGGHSLLIMQLFHRYKTKFHLETNTLSIADLFQHPTISDHAQLIHQSLDNTETVGDYHWSTLDIIQGIKLHPCILCQFYMLFLCILAIASFAQERIFLDEQIRFSSKDNNNMYVIPSLYRLSSTSTTNHVSITRLHQALHAVVTKHSILRTALYLDSKSTLIQHCLDAADMSDQTKPYGFSVVNLANNDRQVNEIINELLNQSDLFDLAKGRVIHCHILRHFQSVSSPVRDDDVLDSDDLILFSIYHAVFDGASSLMFLRDFRHAYENDGSLSVDENALQYIDYSVHERVMNMAASRDFWQSELQGYNLQHPLSLPVDRHHSLADQRSGLGYASQITFDDEISMSFLNYASSHNLTLFQLGLATFYVFLFKLTHGQSDICISSVNANRYRSELQDMIGMFVATLPYRVEFDAHWSFDQVVKHVQEKSLSVLKHSHYSLQQILADFRVNQSNVPFLQTVFDFATEVSQVHQFSLNDAVVDVVPIDDFYDVAKFDFFVRCVYNPRAIDGKLLCRINCSHDLFDQTSVTGIGERFQHLFEQLFSTKSRTLELNDPVASIIKFSLILPKEAEEIRTVPFLRLDKIVGEGK